MEQDVTTLGDHVAIMHRRWRIVVACVILGALGGLGFSALQDPLYTAETTMLLQPEKTSASAVVMDPDEVATQARVIVSSPVAQRVIRELNLDETPNGLLRDVEVEVLEQTRTVAISATQPTARGAAEVANAFAEKYIEYRSETSSFAAEAVREELFNSIASIRSELGSIRDRLDNAELDDRERASLEAKESSLVASLADFRAELLINRSENENRTAGGQVLREAQPPRIAAQPRPFRAAGFGALLGLVVGVLLAYVRDRVDDAIREEDRLRRAVDGQPVLGRIPQDRSQEPRLVTLMEPNSPQSEAYRTLTTNIRFLLTRGGERPEGELVVICSADPGEGKTSVAANVAVTAARVGLKVILVDADFRNPGISDRFGIETPLGLSHVLADQAELDRVVFDARSLDIPGLGIIGGGAIPPNPAELLAGVRALKAWDELRRMADLVVVDTPPVLRVADPLEIVGKADLAILVAQYRISRVRQVETAVERVRQVGGAIGGVAYLGVPAKDTTYGYGTVYGAKPE